MHRETRYLVDTVLGEKREFEVKDGKVLLDDIPVLAFNYA